MLGIHRRSSCRRIVLWLWQACRVQIGLLDLVKVQSRLPHSCSLGCLLISSSVNNTALTGFRALAGIRAHPAIEQQIFTRPTSNSICTQSSHCPSMLTAFDTRTFSNTTCPHGHAQMPADCSSKALRRPQYRLIHPTSHRVRLRESNKGRKACHAESDAGRPHARTASALSTVCDVLVLCQVARLPQILLKVIARDWYLQRPLQVIHACLWEKCRQQTMSHQLKQTRWWATSGPLSTCPQGFCAPLLVLRAQPLLYLVAS